MKRLGVIVALMLVGSFLVPLSASARFGDSARGHGEDINLARFSFTAEGVGTSTDAIGTWKHTESRKVLGIFWLEGDVRCLFVVGNTANIAGVVTRSSQRNREGEAFLVTVQDNDGAGADRYSFEGTTPLESIREICTLTFPAPPITKGNIEVVASTFPT